MKIYTSYFYQLRFFTPNIIPLSTAIWDPKWFHQGKGQDFVYKDKNGVYNGLRAPPFAPGPLCSDDCRGLDNCVTKDPYSCNFMKSYRKQLDKLDFDDIMKRFKRIANYVQGLEKFTEEPIIVLLVHEASRNPCSERRIIQEWFADHGIEVTEWAK